MCLKFPTSEEDMAQRVRRCLASRTTRASTKRGSTQITPEKNAQIEYGIKRGDTDQEIADVHDSSVWRHESIRGNR